MSLFNHTVQQCNKLMVFNNRRTTYMHINTLLPAQIQDTKCTICINTIVFKYVLNTVMSQIAPRREQEPVSNKAPWVDNPLSCLKH